MASAQSTSTSAVLTSLVTNLILFGVFVGSFLILRLRYKRIYLPKSSFDLVPEEKRPEPLPKDPIRWIFILLSKPHSFIIQQAGLDGYFFLRYILIMGLTFGFGLLTWIILLPLNAVRGAGLTGFDQLSISNVRDHSRYWAHAWTAFIYYGAIIFVIYRELFFFNSFRAAVLTLPRYASKLSSRTVLFQLVPDTWLDEKQFFKLFNGVKRIYVLRNTRALDHAVRKREALALRLEAATTQLLIKGMKEQAKRMKKTKMDVNLNTPALSDLVPAEKRPRHRSRGWFSAKVDTIKWCRIQLAEVDAQVRELQRKYRKYQRKNSIFVEFNDQYTAQLAYQLVSHHTPLRMAPTYIGMMPLDIDHLNMRMFWWERIAREALATAAIVALIILWAIPVAFVGVISNINYLEAKLSWLQFINKLPKWILGVVTGLLPSVMLSLLLMVLPMFIRAMAKVAGAISVQQTESFTQTAYFYFLVVNGFLVTALASSAASTVVAIIDEPSDTLSILAQSLPKSSNFYISYLILQGLSVAGGSLFQVVTFILFFVLGAILDKTLRKKWARFSVLGTMSWGTTFPLFTLLATITIAFSIIAPLILIFACGAFLLIYIAYCHNLTYCFVESSDLHGSHYPVALFHTFTGLYLGNLCLLGIFIVGKGWGPIVIQVITLSITVFAHAQMKIAFEKLLEVVPIDCMRPLDGKTATVSFKGHTDYAEKFSTNSKAARNDKFDADKINQDLLETGNHGGHLVPLMADRDFKSTKSANFIVRWLRPDVYLNFRNAKKMIPACYNEVLPYEDNVHAYDAPNILAGMPLLWIPRDPYGWSTEQIEENKDIVAMLDENSGFNESNKPVFLGKAPY